jgi:hypothetical protein
MQLSSTDFEELADDMLLRRSRAIRNMNRRFRSTMGVSSSICSWYWNQLDKRFLIPAGFLPKHFLWTLLFLKLYCSETVNALLCDCDEKTFRKWTWIGIGLIGDLDMVRIILPYINLLFKALTNYVIVLRLYGKTEIKNGMVPNVE